MTTSAHTQGRPFAIAGVEISDELISKAEKYLTADYPFVIFSLAHCQLADEKAQRLFQAVLNCPTILGLMCAGTPFSLCAVKELGKLIQERPITSLCLRDCAVNPEAIKVLTPAIKTAQVLHELNLSENPIGTAGTQNLLLALEQNRSIKALDLEQCELESDAIISLQPALESGQLEQVNLGYNHLGDPGIEKLAKCVKTAQPVSLKLDQCDFSSKGLDTLVSALTQSDQTPRIKALSLNHNQELGDEAMKSIAKLLTQVPTISSLGLVNCNISETGVAYLKDALANYPEEIRIDMGGNEISEKGFSALNEALSGAQRLRWVALDDPADSNMFYVLTAMAGLNAHAVHQHRQIPAGTGE